MGLLNDPLVGVLYNCEREEVEDYDEEVASLTDLGFHTKNPVKLDLDLKIWESSLAKPSILEPSKIESKPLQPHLKYIFLEEDETLPIVIASDLDSSQVEALKLVVKKSI